MPTRTAAGARTTAGARTAASRTIGQGLTFAANGYVSLGTLGVLGSSLAAGFYFSITFSTTTTNQDILFGTKQSGTSMLAICQLNTNGATNAAAQNKLKIIVRDASNNVLQGGNTNAVTVNDGLPHTITCSMNFTTKVITLTIDGSSVPVSYNTQAALSNFANFTIPAFLGAHNNAGAAANYFTGNISAFQIGTTSSTLFGSYALTENAGGTTADASGQGNVGTLSGPVQPQWASQMAVGRRTVSSSTPIPIIIDSDAASDIDDAGAFTCAFQHQLLGDCTVLGINIDTSSTYSPGAIDTIRKYLGLAAIPISSHAAVGTFLPAGANACYQFAYNNFAHDVGLAASLSTPTTNLRTLLAARTSADVVFLGLGYGNDLAALLQSTADGISPLTGIQLVAASVKRLVWTGGIYPNGTDPANFARDLTDAAYVINNWPTPIIFFPGGASPGSIGGNIFSPNTLSSLSVLNPCKAIYQQFGAPDSGHASWDLCTAMIGIEGIGAWQLTGPGTNSLNTGTGVNTFTLGVGQHYYATNNQPYGYYQNHFTELLKC